MDWAGLINLVAVAYRGWAVVVGVFG